MKYIDAELLRKEVKRLEKIVHKSALDCADSETRKFHEGKALAYQFVGMLIDSLQQEQQMPDSTQLIAEWKKEKAVLEQKDFRGDAERMAYNAFLDGFVKGLGYGRTE